MPELPGTVVENGRKQDLAVYPVEGTKVVGTEGGSSAAAPSGQIPHSKASDNLSTAAIKNGTVGSTTVDGLSGQMERTNLESTSGGLTGHAYEPGTFKRENLSSTPFNHEEFFRQFGDGNGTTTYESKTQAAVVQETVKPSLLEQVHPVFHREHHVIHHQTRIQPVLEQVLLPPKHYVVIDGQKHEILPEAVMNHVVKSRDWIPMSGVKPKVVVHQYVDNEPLVGPLTGVGASLINRDVMLEHQRMINQSYEQKAVGQNVGIPTGTITKVNYLPNQVPVSTEPGHGSATLAESSISGLTSSKSIRQSAGSTSGHHHNSNHSSTAAYPVGNTPGNATLAETAIGANAHLVQGSGSPTTTRHETGNHLPLDAAIERTSERLSDQRATKH